MTRTTLSLLVLSAAGSLIFAQGRFGGAHPPGGYAPLNLQQTQTITGVITAADLGYAARYPSITVNQAVIKVAPLWFLLDHDFELRVNDAVSVLAAPGNLPGDSYLYAISIINTATSATVTLRDSSGFPLWSGGRPTRNLPAARSAWVDPTSIRTISGTVDRVSLGAGIQMPSLVVKMADGTLVTVRIGPERVLLAADFELNPGEAVTVTMASCPQENIALELINSAGVTLVLRNPDGTPAWN